MFSVRSAAFLSFFLVLVLPAGVEAQVPSADVEGTWHGTLEAGGQKLTVIFHLQRGEEGALTATMDVPQQGARGIPVSDVHVTADSLRLDVAQIGGTFAGAFQGTATTVDGTWRQGGGAFPLVLEQGSPEAGGGQAPARPQEPEPPLPYDTREVTFPGGDEAVTLAGTLTLPQGAGPHPAVVLVSGSGPQNRNEELAGHRPFLVLADALTRRGVAVLRYDDRGVAESTGNFSQATTHDFAADARAALDYLREQDDMNLGKVGLIGHSEGGLVAPMIAARHPDAVDFIVLLAGPGVPGDALLARQNALLFERSGMSAEGAAAYERRMKAALQRLDAVPPAEPLPDSVRTALRADFRAAARAMSPADRAVYGPTDTTAFARVLDRMTRQLSTSWMRSFLASDPQAVLREVDVPVLALLGEKDLQVPPEQNAPALRKAFADHPDATVKVLPGLNHLFQTADTGLPGEYSQIEETFAPKALDLIGDWIAERTRADAQE